MMHDLVYLIRGHCEKKKGWLCAVGYSIEMHFEQDGENVIVQVKVLLTW
jgi:hypothetical protein